MISRWFHLKPQAIILRHSGKSLREIEKELGIPRSTLSGWFKVVKLDFKAKRLLTKRRLDHLKEARKLARIWHIQQKETRLKEAEDLANRIIDQIPKNNLAIQKLALAMLYLGEGGKTKNGTSLASSDPIILKFFVKMLLREGVKKSKIKCALHLRADQDPELLKDYWSKEIGVSPLNFTLPSIDLRTQNRPTYAYYNGVCVVSCGNIALQRQLVFLAKKFCVEID